MTDLADIAANLGLPVFACDGSKRPCVKGGFKAATSDRKAILGMFRTPGAKMIGVPTGSVSGIIVIDVDIKNGAPGMAWLDENRDALPETRTHKTRSGGLHLVFQCPPDVEIRNSASRIAPGIDVRGEGGYIIVPPSEGYQIADPTPPAEMPRWLIRACLRQEEPQAAIPVRHDPISEGGTKYGLAALDSECAAIRAAYPGTQENTLNAAALKIGALVAGGQIDAAVARHALIQAGNSMVNASGDRPWTHTEIENKVRRGMDDGARKPRAPAEQNGTRRDSGGTHSKMSRQPEESVPAGQVPNRILPYFRFAEAEPNIDVADFVEGLLIEGAMSVIYGESNSGKTFWTTDVALHVAAGMEWNGREVSQGGVIYVAMEGSHGIRNRIAAFKQENGMEDANLPFVVVPIGLNLLDPGADATALIATVKAVADEFETPVKMIVIDTLARAMAGGNENASEDMSALVGTGDQIREATGAHLTWIHHSGKDTAKGARGHSSLRAATDTEIEITADGNSRQADVRKQRDLEGGDTFRFELEVVTLGTNRRGKEVTSCVVKTTSEQAASAAPDPRKSLNGHSRRALDVLTDLVAASGQPGHGAPIGVNSVPEQWWRERFYDSAMAGADLRQKQQAFRRASDNLVERSFVGMRSGRVWVVQRHGTGQNNVSSQ